MVAGGIVTITPDDANNRITISATEQDTLASVRSRGGCSDCLTSSDIAAGAITASELADSSVDTAAIQDNAVTTAKIANIDCGVESIDSENFLENVGMLFLSRRIRYRIQDFSRRYRVPSRASSIVLQQALRVFALLLRRFYEIY